MNVLLAPNGKPSNLTPEQYKLVRTPEFKAWFGDWQNDPANASKVIDEETKEPLVVYHGYLVGGGAGKKFYEFKNLPAFFSKTKKFAYEYASTKSMDAELDADIYVYACFLNIKKLFDVKNKSNIELAKEQLPEKIQVSHGTMWFLSADIPKEELIEKIQGIITIPKNEMTEDILASKIGDIIAEKVSASQYENKILLYKDEDWGYITDAQRFDEIVNNEIAEWVNNDYEKTIKYKGKYLKTFILIEGTYKLELNKDPLFLEFQNEVEKRKKYYIDNILKLLKQSHNLTITIKNKKGYPMNFYVQKINLKTYKTTTKNNWTMFENETLQKFLINNNFGGWCALERGDKTYGVYDNKNIKLADGSNTTFDEKNPDIRFEEGGGVKQDFKYSLTFGGITIYTNIEQEYIGENYSPFESKGSFKASVRKNDLVNIAIESEQLKDFNFQWGVDDWKSISQKLKNKGINKLELYLTNGIIKTYELKVLNDSDNPDMPNVEGGLVNLNAFNEKMKTELKKSDYEHRETLDEKRKLITYLYANEYYSKNNIIPLAEPDDETSIYWQSISINDKNYIISIYLYFHDFSNPFKITESNIDFYDEDYNKLNNPDIRFDEGGLIAPNGKPRKDRFGDTIFEDVWLLTRNEYANESINVHSGDSLNRKKTSLQDYMQKNITNVQHKNRVLKAINENKYENAIQNGWITKERANEIIKSAELDIIFSDDNNINWNVDRYRQVEKEMFELRKQGKFDSLEYFKLIKERSVLEQDKMKNSEKKGNENFAKGGSVIAYKKDFAKFNKIGVTDKYVIEVISEIGLQGINFDAKSIEDKITQSFNDLLKEANTNEYIISEDSEAITNSIQNDIRARYNQGDTEENIREYQKILNNNSKRKELYIDKYAESQKETINEWISYLKQSEYPVAIKYLLLKSVLNFNYDYKTNVLIKRTAKTIRNFTPFDAGSLSELIPMNSDYLLKDYTQIQVSNAVNVLKNNELAKTSSGGSWLKFDGGSKTDEKKREENSKELSKLVQNTYWCTKTNAKSQLDGGDFYVYVTENNGEVFPRIAIRMNEDKVGEVRGNKSSAQDLEDDMIPIAKEFLENNLDNDSGKKWLDGIDYNQKALDLYNKLNSEGLFKNSIEEFIELKSNEKQNLLDYADRNGHIVRIEKLIDNLIKLPNEYYKKYEVIFNLSDFNPEVTRIILGDVSFTDSKITDLGNLQIIGGHSDFYNSELTYLGNLTSIGGDADFRNSKLTDLGNLTKIGGDANFINSQVTDLGSLTSIGGNADFLYSKITNLGNLQTIGSNAYFRNSQVTNLGNLTTIGRNADFEKSQVTNLGNLTTIGNLAVFINSQVTDLGNLTSIGGNANFPYSKITNLGNLQTIGGYADFKYSKITDLGNLTSIGYYAKFSDSQVTSLANLTSIDGNAYFENSQITDLGNLQTIGGYIDFGNRDNLKEMWDKRNSPKKFETIESKYAKGGKVVVLPADIQKYKKIGIEDKYFIEASKDVGLQGINFDSESIRKRIEEQFNEMLDRYKFYLIDDDSPSITNYINNEIETHKEQGSSLETIQRLEQMKDNETSRRSVIEDIAKTQNESLEKWVDYLRLSEYKLPFKFMILKAVLNFNYDLKQNKLFERGRDTIRNFTPFDAGSLAELNEKNSDFLLMDYNVIMNENSSRILNSQEVVEQSGNGKWIKFNGGSKTKPEDIEKNGNRLMNLVQNTYWCTKSAGTSQLRGGDFYVYVTESNGEIFPRIAVRMNEDKVGEVRGNKSSAQDLDAEMLPIAEEFLNKNIPNDSGKKWLDSIKYNKKCVEMRKRFEAEGMYKDFIYDYIKLIADKDKYKVDYGANGNVTLLEQKLKEIIQVPNEYYQQGDIVTDFNLLSEKTIYYIGDLGFYELSRLKQKRMDSIKLKCISGDLYIAEGRITDLDNIEFVGGNVRLSNQDISIGKLKYIGGELMFNDANIESLSNLESVGGILVLKRITKDLGKLKKVGGLVINSCDDNFSLGMLEEIEGDLQILNSSVDINFGNLKTIGGSLFANDTIITDLKNLESVGKDFFIQRSKIKKFENLKTIGGYADFSNNFCSSTQNIESILGNVLFLNSRIMDFPKLNKIGGLINFKGSYFKSFGNIKYIGGNLNFSESKVEELGNLEYVGGFVSFKGSKIKTLNKLKKIVGFANFDSSDVENLGDLESVGGNIYLNLTKIKSLGKLNYVGGLVMMKKDNYKFSDINYDLISEQLKK